MKKQSWSGTSGFVLAAVGAAVGLGNIWGFPRHMAKGGGLLFLLLYLVLALLVGYPMLLGELSVGRETGKKPRGAFRALTGSAAGGVLGEIASLLMMGFYSVLGGCCIRYMLVNLVGVFKSGDRGGLSLFLSYISNIPLSAMCTVLFILMSAGIIMAGVSKGLERFSKIAMPLLILMLPGIIACSMTIPGAAEGLRLMFSMPETLSLGKFFSTLSRAAVQMFFSLSLGLGCMITYGAYLPGKISIPKSAAVVVIADTLIAVLAGFAVLPAAHAVGGTEQDGAMLMFVTMQGIFDAYGAWGSMFGFLFYVLMLLAALTSAVSLMEVIASTAGEESGRVFSAVFAAALASIPAVAIARDGMGFGALPEILGMSWLDAAELFSEGILIPLCSLVLCLALRPARAEEMLRRQLGGRVGKAAYIATKYFAPPLLISVMGIKIFSVF
ncbi:MAG: sodium-dependent transporter [Oscillospiraceae bacterium]